jgi:hypothetical protein
LSTMRIIVPDQGVPLPQDMQNYVPPERKGVTVPLDKLEREVAVQDEVNEARRDAQQPPPRPRVMATNRNVQSILASPWSVTRRV